MYHNFEVISEWFRKKIYIINSCKNDHYSQSNALSTCDKWYDGQRALKNYFILFDRVTKYVIKRCQCVRKICQTKAF